MSKNCNWRPDRQTDRQSEEAALQVKRFWYQFSRLFPTLSHATRFVSFGSHQGMVQSVQNVSEFVSHIRRLFSGVIIIAIAFILRRHPTRHCPGVRFCLSFPHFPLFPHFSTFLICLPACLPVGQFDSLSQKFPSQADKLFPQSLTAGSNFRKYQLAVRWTLFNRYCFKLLALKYQKY